MLRKVIFSFVLLSPLILGVPSLAQFSADTDTENLAEELATRGLGDLTAAYGDISNVIEALNDPRIEGVFRNYILGID